MTDVWRSLIQTVFHRWWTFANTLPASIEPVWARTSWTKNTCWFKLCSAVSTTLQTKTVSELENKYSISIERILICIWSVFTRYSATCRLWVEYHAALEQVLRVYRSHGWNPFEPRNNSWQFAPIRRGYFHKIFFHLTFKSFDVQSCFWTGKSQFSKERSAFHIYKNLDEKFLVNLNPEFVEDFFSTLNLINEQSKCHFEFLACRGYE